MSNLAREFRNLRVKQNFQDVSVSSAFEICKSYAQTLDSIHGNVEVISFFFGTQEFTDRMLLGQALALLEDCLPRVRKLLRDLLKNLPAEDNLVIPLTEMITIAEMLRDTVTFFREKFNWTKHHLTLRSIYLHNLDILTEIFDFAKKTSFPGGGKCHELYEKLMGIVCELYRFILDKLTSSEINFFTENSTVEREFLTEVLRKLFYIGEVTPSISPMIYSTTWKSTNKLITFHSRELQRGSGDFLREPVLLLCKRIRDGICEAMQKSTLVDTQKTLKITKFHTDLLKRLIGAFPGDFVPHTEKILENLVFMQSAKYLRKSSSIDEIHKTITSELMQSIGVLEKNQNFIECLLNTNFSHDTEIYAFLMISMEILRSYPSNSEEMEARKAAVMRKTFSIVRKCDSILLSHPEVFEDFCRNFSLAITTNYTEEKYKAVWIDFMRSTLKEPTVFSSITLLQLWKNIQIASRENIRFESFVMWKNILEKLPRVSTTHTLLIETLLRVSFDCLSKESQQRVVSLNNPLESHFFWSILGINVITNPEKRKYVAQGLSGKVLKLISDFLTTTCSAKSFEDMILILKILGRSSFDADKSFTEKFLEMWVFIGRRINGQEKQKKLLGRIVIPLLEIFRNICSSLNPGEVGEITKILREIAEKDWPCGVQVEILKSLKIISEADSSSYWGILRAYKKSTGTLQLLSAQVEKTIGLAETESVAHLNGGSSAISEIPPNKKFKPNLGADDEVKLQKILNDVKEFSQNCPPGHILTPRCNNIVREMMSSLNKLKQS